jgi:3D (Asp-Asp-Asp) domain-containing protein
MRIIRLVASLLILAAILLPGLTLASTTSDTDINTNRVFSIVTNLFSSQNAQAKTGDANLSKAETQEAEPEKTVKDSKTEEIISQWKEKQADKWADLPKDRFTINASAYTAASDECGKNDGVTASGVKVEANRTIACPSRFPFGVKIDIEGMGTFVCEDRGGAIKGNHIDIYVPTKKEAFAFGRQNRSARVVID